MLDINQAHNLIGPRSSCDISPRTFHFPAFILGFISTSSQFVATQNSPKFDIEGYPRTLVEYSLSEDHPSHSNHSERLGAIGY